MVREMIQKENDIKKLDEEQLKELANEIRQFLIEKISRTGGHLASNLGVVELTMALHLTLDFPIAAIVPIPQQHAVRFRSMGMSADCPKTVSATVAPEYITAVIFTVTKTTTIITDITVLESPSKRYSKNCGTVYIPLFRNFGRNKKATATSVIAAIHS